ncbi:hypothetical protein Hanom_Chr06g00507591 [Helianthus anomalus]
MVVKAMTVAGGGCGSVVADCGDGGDGAWCGYGGGGGRRRVVVVVAMDFFKLQQDDAG